MFGCMTSNAITEKILAVAVKKAGLWGDGQKLYYPIILKQGTNEAGKRVRYFFNYSAKPINISYTFANGRDLLHSVTVNKNRSINLEPWGIKIVEEQ